jgi:hypothetical protein
VSVDLQTSVAKGAVVKDERTQALDAEGSFAVLNYNYRTKLAADPNAEQHFRNGDFGFSGNRFEQCANQRPLVLDKRDQLPDLRRGGNPWAFVGMIRATTSPRASCSTVCRSTPCAISWTIARSRCRSVTRTSRLIRDAKPWRCSIKDRFLRLPPNAEVERPLVTF